LPESFRGGCSFGAGIKADLSRRDCLEEIGRKHSHARAVNAAAASVKGFALVRQAPDLLFTFWTPPSPLSKSVPAERGQQNGIYGFACGRALILQWAHDVLAKSSRLGGLCAEMTHRRDFGAFLRLDQHERR
jgi:hypothetical protein